ncbi:MAG: hypothetical protein FD129_2478 [bacterium]|nr:MAG: hypothetical protein FD129_2478 [bacterium]
MNRLILSVLDVGIRLDRRRGAGQKRERAVMRRPQYGHVARMIPGRLLLFVGRVLLVFHHDQARVRNRREDRQPRSDHDRDLAAPGLLPFHPARTVRKSAVEYSDPATDPVPQRFGPAGNAADFGNEDDHRPSPTDRLQNDGRYRGSRPPRIDVQTNGRKPAGTNSGFKAQWHGRDGALRIARGLRGNGRRGSLRNGSPFGGQRTS